MGESFSGIGVYVQRPKPKVQSQQDAAWGHAAYSGRATRIWGFNVRFGERWILVGDGAPTEYRAARQRRLYHGLISGDAAEDAGVIHQSGEFFEIHVTDGKIVVDGSDLRGGSAEAATGYWAD